MKIMLATISARRSSSGPMADLVELYLKRCKRHTDCEARAFASEAKLFAFLDETSARTKPALVLADSRGQQLSSPEFAGILGVLQDGGTQLVVFAIGPGDGWSPAALKRADRTVAFGRITLPHELAAVVFAEQIYRALTIRAGHPYHSGHE